MVTVQIYPYEMSAINSLWTIFTILFILHNMMKYKHSKTIFIYIYYTTIGFIIGCACAG